MQGQQLSLFDALRSPPIVVPVQPNGEVIQGDPDEFHFLPHPRLAWHRGEIELHQHTDGGWMWSTSAHVGDWGYGYRVGPKWGKFAECRDDALHYAVEEIVARLTGRRDQKAAAEVIAWARGLQ
ncbi:MAG: hypothetical protein CML66_25755 [Rhodobacteraceae bacterium]|nr:hypothetical protein [Paracoccaceae bacterium]MAY44671.1 hypothetical protein [Paracoccaceae bacterium]|tara:strand:- start:576 stop:947 length:372 start_codon:yes stop_codon:yes gene_type:complete